MDKLSTGWILKGAQLCSGGMGGVACFLQHLCFCTGTGVQSHLPVGFYVLALRHHRLFLMDLKTIDSRRFENTQKWISSKFHNGHLNTIVYGVWRYKKPSRSPWWRLKCCKLSIPPYLPRFTPTPCTISGGPSSQAQTLLLHKLRARAFLKAVLLASP